MPHRLQLSELPAHHLWYVHNQFYIHFQNYLNYFRYGCPPHGGLGLGLSRLLMVMLDLPNIREAVYLFGGPNRLEP